MANDDPASANPDRIRVAYRHRRHGPYLGIYLGFLLVRSIVSIIVDLSLWDRLAARIPHGELQALGAVLLLRPVCLAAIWFWSRTGVIAYIIVTTVYLTLLSMFMPTSTYGIFGMVSPFILILLVRGEWKLMRWGVSLHSKRVVDDGLDY